MKKDLSVMIKPASSICNMRCKYCFYHSLADSREVFSYGLMNENTAKNVIEKAIDFCDGGSVCFAFQGGEPLFAGKEYFEFFVKHADGYSQGKCKLYYTLQTNGTLIDDEWARIFRSGTILVGLSVDGDELLNGMRVYRNGGETFPCVMNAADILKRNGVEFNAVSVVTREVARNIREAYRFLKTHVSKYIQFIPVLKSTVTDERGVIDLTPRYGEPGGEDADYALGADDYYAYLTGAFDEYLKDILTGDYTSVRYFDNLVRLSRMLPAELCGMNGGCERQFVIEADGTVYPCDFFCTDAYALGNINTTSCDVLARSERAARFLEEGSAVREECKSCQYYKLCGGGCKREAADIDKCAATKKFLRENLRHLVRIR